MDQSRPASDAGSRCDLTVVVACVEASRSIARCLAALKDACRGIRAQIILADASRDDTLAAARPYSSDVDVLQYPAGTLVPSLWAAGLHMARGGAVAFTLGQMIVSQSWARALLDGLGKADGVGGPLLLAPEADVVDTAVFCLRYSSFIPAFMPDGPVRGEIAGDNAAYRREALDRHRPSVEQGFWELEFHRLLRADGGTLAAASGALARFSGAPALASMARHRYEHGREFGVSRREHGESRVRIVAAAPLVPPLLAWRSARRVLREPAIRRRLPAALPALLTLAGFWAAGEARGALSR